jgi:hypothetical protein
MDNDVVRLGRRYARCLKLLPDGVDLAAFEVCAADRALALGGTSRSRWSCVASFFDDHGPDSGEGFDLGPVRPNDTGVEGIGFSMHKT